MRARLQGGPETSAGSVLAETGTVEVDFADMRHLVATMRGLAAELAGNGYLCSHFHDPDLADAFSRVDHNWHKQRVTLQTFLDMGANSLAATLATYRQLETELVQASRGAR